MAKKQKKDNDWVSWALIIFLFAVGLSPIALLLLFLKLFKGDGKKQISSKTAQSAGQIEDGHPNRAKTAVGKVTRSPAVKKSNAKGLQIGGAVVSAMGVIACVEPIDMMIWLGEIESYYVEDLLAALAILAAGAAMLGSGISMSRGLKRYAKYLAVLGDRDAMPIEELARTLGYS